MKYSINKKSLVFVLVAFLFSMNLKAQEFNSGKSIGDQIRNNAVPNLKYAAPEGTVSATKQKPFEGSSLMKQIKEGKLGMQVETDNGSKAARPTTPVQTTKNTLSSEMSAAEAKAIADAKKENQQPVKVIPSQEEPKGEPVKKD